eukprot:432119-Amphidinium_carterae.1
MEEAAVGLGSDPASWIKMLARGFDHHFVYKRHQHQRLEQMLTCGDGTTYRNQPCLLVAEVGTRTAITADHLLRSLHCLQLLMVDIFPAPVARERVEIYGND